MSRLRRFVEDVVDDDQPGSRALNESSDLIRHILILYAYKKCAEMNGSGLPPRVIVDPDYSASAAHGNVISSSAFQLSLGGTK